MHARLCRRGGRRHDAQTADDAATSGKGQGRQQGGTEDALHGGLCPGSFAHALRHVKHVLDGLTARHSGQNVLQGVPRRLQLAANEFSRRVLQCMA